MVTILLGISLAVLDGTIVNLALPAITHDLNATASHAIWVVNAFQICTLAMLLPCAMLGDLFGYRRVYLVGLAIFTAASLACTFADSLMYLTIARGVQGLGAGGVMAVNAALVRLTYPKAKLGRGVALNSLVVATASVAGPSAAAAVLSLASWPWLFAINVPLGIVVLAMGWKALPFNTAPRPEGVKFSWLDVLLNALMFGLVFLGADALGTRAGDEGAKTPIGVGVGMLVGGLAIGAFFLTRQARRRVPMFPIDLLQIPVFRLSMCTSVMAFAGQMLSFIALPFLLLDTYGLSHTKTGLLITCWPLAIVVTAPIAGRLIGRVSDGLLGGIGLGILACGLALLAALPTHPGDLDIAWRMAVCGAGFGLFQSPNNHTIVSSAPVNRSGAASGMLGTARLTGQTLGAVLLAIIFSVASAHDGQGPVIALGLAAAFAAVGGAFSSMRVKHHRPQA
ncbi:MAG: transporter [Rhizobacter sp.]|nr:transporter [Rhizobacter sp.]